MTKTKYSIHDVQQAVESIFVNVVIIALTILFCFAPIVIVKQIIIEEELD